LGSIWGQLWVNLGISCTALPRQWPRRTPGMTRCAGCSATCWAPLSAGQIPSPTPFGRTRCQGHRKLSKSHHIPVNYSLYQAHLSHLLSRPLTRGQGAEVFTCTGQHHPFNRSHLSKTLSRPITSEPPNAPSGVRKWGSPARWPSAAAVLCCAASCAANQPPPRTWWILLATSSNALLTLAIARHVIQRTFDPRLSSQFAIYDFASNACQAHFERSSLGSNGAL